MDNLKKKINEQRIKDTARQVLSHSVSSGKFIFYLNKQAAFASKVNFTEGNSTLGDITVTIPSDDPEALIIELTGLPEPKNDSKEKGNKDQKNKEGDQ